MTDEMVEAATRAWCLHDDPACEDPGGPICWGGSDVDALRVALAAALTAAPTVDRLLAYFPGQTADSDEAWACWCVENMLPDDDGSWVITTQRDCRALDCPGPHRHLNLGPEVQA